MNKIISTILLSLVSVVNASEPFLTTVYQPLGTMQGGPPEVHAVPYIIASGAMPEIIFSGVTAAHIPQQSSPGLFGDINLASLAGILVHAESAASGQRKVHVVFDFSKAKPELVTKELIVAVIECIEKTASSIKLDDKPIGLYSKFIGAKGFPTMTKLIEARMPMQTKEQSIEDAKPNHSN
jgi:hypothetical protein